MGHNSHHHLLSFNLLHNSKKEVSIRASTVPPKGCVAVKVGGDGEEQQKFVVPVVYLNHPLFLSLLKQAEEEYGFDHKGAITIPCHVEYFRQVEGIINRDTGSARSSSNHAHHHQHHPRLLTCFRA